MKVLRRGSAWSGKECRRRMSFVTQEASIRSSVWTEESKSDMAMVSSI